MNLPTWLLFACLASSHGSALAQLPPAAKVTLSVENRNFEWFFLLTDAASARGIWANNGLEPKLVPSAGSAAQLKQQIEAGLNLGWVNTAEVLLARAQGAPVKIVSGYLGDTIAKIYADPSAAI